MNQRKAGRSQAFKGNPFRWTNTPILDGINDYVDFNQLITMPDEFTVSIWFKTDSLDANQTIVAGDSGTGYLFTAEKPRFEFDINLGDSVSASQYSFTGGIPTNQWNHLMWTRTLPSYEVEVWLNGVASTSGSFVQNATIAYSRFGQYLSGLAPFGGNVNEIAIWTGVAGTITNAQDLYNSGAGAYAYDIIANPYLYIRCNEGIGTVLNDIGTGVTNADLVNVTGTYWGTH